MKGLSNTNNKVSIRITGGHSFSVPATQGRISEVELLTERTLLVPEQFYAADGCRAAFTAAGMPLDEEDATLSIRTDKGMMALIALSSETLEKLHSTFGDEVHYTTPLLHPVGNIEPTIWICDTEDLIYIKVYDPKLQMAEVIAIQSEADRDYLLSRLCATCDPKRYTVRLTLRSNNKQILKLYKNTFKRLQCE